MQAPHRCGAGPTRRQPANGDRRERRIYRSSFVPTIASKAERSLQMTLAMPERSSAYAKPVPLGKRGILWDWFGQISHLPPPSDGIACRLCRKPACIFHVPGVSSRAIPSPENTAHLSMEHERAEKTGHIYSLISENQKKVTGMPFLF